MESAPQLRSASPAGGRSHHLTGTGLPHPPTGNGDWPLADASAPRLESACHHDARHLLQAQAGRAGQAAATHNREEPNPMPEHGRRALAGRGTRRIT